MDRISNLRGGGRKTRRISGEVKNPPTVGSENLDKTGTSSPWIMSVHCRASLSYWSALKSFDWVPLPHVPSCPRLLQSPVLISAFANVLFPSRLCSMSCVHLDFLQSFESISVLLNVLCPSRPSSMACVHLGYRCPWPSCQEPSPITQFFTHHYAWHGQIIFVSGW